MAIIRTPLIDDDGSGSTGTILNNAWQTGLYNAIDAAIAPVAPVYGSWIPTDASAAGLTLQGGTGGSWAKVGRIVLVWCQAIYPATADTNAAVLGGLPFIVRSPAAATQGYGPHYVWNPIINSTQVVPYAAATGVNIPNSTLSGVSLVLSAVYLTD